ncbi:MAG: TadE/TadG family type IV pilus assembly protein [Ilumatobacteraceae bacterium]
MNCRTARNSGQATVELALAMPVLCLLLLAVVQFAVVVRNQLVAIEVARSTARAAAVAVDPAGAATAAGGAADQSPRPTVSTTSDGTYVTVTVTITDPTDVPMIGALLPDVTVRASSTMILEPP